MSELFTPSDWFSPDSWFDPETPEALSGGGFSGDVEYKLALGSATVEPFIWPHLADKITLDSFTNVSSFKAYLEGADGPRVLLNDNAAGVPKQRPSGQTTEYAGSWAQDFGADGVTDLGIDHAATTGGVSSSVLGDWHRATAFQMLADRTATYLVIVMTPADPSLEITFDGPLFEYTKSANRKIIPENAHQAAVIHPSGPGVRFAGFNTGTSGTINNPPAIYDGYERPNIVDWLCFERLLVEGIAHDDGLTTELTTLFDTYEGQSVGSTRNNSYGFMLPVGSANWCIALVSSLQECPPLGAFPRLERNPATWLTTGDPVQHTWVWAQDPSYLVNPATVAHLRADDDVTVWTTAGGGIAGWAISSHSHAVDNDETDFGIWANSIRFGELRPFRGHYMVLLPSQSGGITYAVGRDLSHFRAYIDMDGFIVTEWADNTLTWDNVTQTFEATQIHYSVTRLGPINVRLSFSDGVKVYYCESTNGKDCGTPVEIADGTRMITVDCNDGGHFKYYYSGGDILGKQYDAAGTLIGSSFTAVAGVDDAQFDGHASSKGGNNFRIVLYAVVSGTPTEFVSSNGIDFA
jgi:hypothetical protein